MAEENQQQAQQPIKVRTFEDIKRNILAADGYDMTKSYDKLHIMQRHYHRRQQVDYYAPKIALVTLAFSAFNAGRFGVLTRSGQAATILGLSLSPFVAFQPGVAFFMQSSGADQQDTPQ